MTDTVVMNLLRERPLVEAEHGGCRTMSQPVQQASDLPVTEHTPLVALPVAWKDIERPCVTYRYQLQHQRFRRSKPRRVHGEFFEQFQHGLPKLRQYAEILAEQVEPVPRRWLSISLPGHAGGLEMIIQDFDSWRPPFGKGFGRLVANEDVRLEQSQPW